MLYPTADSSINKSTFTDSLKHDLDYSLNNGEVSIFKDARIDSIQKGLSEDPTISGWTVQLLVSQQKEEINSTKIKFLKAFPDQQLFDEYKTPNTYLYVGRFYDKISAYHFKNEINYLFKNTRVLKKSIEAPVLPGRKNTEKEVEKNSNPSIEKSE
jgi:hypothetical protein